MIPPAQKILCTLVNDSFMAKAKSFSGIYFDFFKETTEEGAPGENEKLSKYWNAVKECPSDFTSWTCLLQIIDQEVVDLLFAKI